jgi:integrase
MYISRMGPEVLVGSRWRLVRTERSGGLYFVLEKGRARDRVGLTLGYIAQEAADSALTQVQLEEDGGTVGRVLRLYERVRQDAIRYLVGDASVEEVLGPAEPDYASMKLREYYESVYAPVRKQDRPRGWSSEQRHWKLLNEAIGDVKLRSIDEFVLADHLDAMVVTRGKRAGESTSGTTKRLQRAALKALLKWAYRHKHIAKVPELSVFRIEGATKAVREKPDPLTLQELVAVMDAATEPRLRALFAVGAGQGLRPSELVALEWEDTDWSVPSLRVRGTKTAAAADTIPMTPLVRRELRLWWTKCGEPTKGLIFPNEDGEAYASSTGYKQGLETAAKNAGLGRDVYPYLLRDSFATIAWSVGIDKDVARRVMRHSDDKMLDRVYCRPRPAALAAVAKFDLVSEE